MYIVILSFFFNTPPTPELYTLSLHDALPISGLHHIAPHTPVTELPQALHPTLHRARGLYALATDRKSTRLNSSHVAISYAVFCLKKKKTPNMTYKHYYHVIIGR